MNLSLVSLWLCPHPHVATRVIVLNTCHIVSLAQSQSPSSEPCEIWLLSVCMCMLASCPLGEKAFFLFLEGSSPHLMAIAFATPTMLPRRPFTQIAAEHIPCPWPSLWGLPLLHLLQLPPLFPPFLSFPLLHPSLVLKSLSDILCLPAPSTTTLSVSIIVKTQAGIFTWYVHCYILNAPNKAWYIIDAQQIFGEFAAVYSRCSKCASSSLDLIAYTTFLAI